MKNNEVMVMDIIKLHRYPRLFKGIVCSIISILLTNTQAFAEANDAGVFTKSQDNGVKVQTEHILNSHEAIFMADYLDMRLPNDEAIDLIGYHLLTPVNDWLYIGLGSYAPFLNGEYGGFMAFGVKAHAQREIVGNLFANGGLAFGGGGGGKSIAHSAILSGTGGYRKGYLGLGYEFKDFSLGANVSHMKFIDSMINNTGLNIFVQRPFSYSTGKYSTSGRYYATSKTQGSRYGEVIALGLDNFSQISPKGTYKGRVHTVDVQFSKFMSPNAYWYYEFGVGYRGLPTYNQVFGGFGYRHPISSNFNFYGQLGVGSGGYAPSHIDTGSGLLIYPKLSIEYKLRDNLGLALTGGYMYAPDGTSRNNAVGAMLNYHTGSEKARPDTLKEKFDGYRFSLTHETAFNLEYNNINRKNLSLGVIQLDKIINDHLYIPLRAAISYQSYRGFPGYGEITAGVGWNSKYAKGDWFQFFNELQIGANVEGQIVKAVTGLDYGLSEDIALRAMLGKTVGQDGFSATNIGLGITRRFSLR